MKNRMTTHQLDEKSTLNLLERVHVGSFATINANGTPYVIPVHFVVSKNAIYFHSALRGKKIDNITYNLNVCFLAYEMMNLIQNDSGRPCNTNTKYESAIIFGKAEIVTDEIEKMQALKKIVEKYTPNLKDAEISQVAASKTLVVKISMEKVTGKYY